MFLYKGALQNGTFKQQKKALKTLWEHFSFLATILVPAIPAFLPMFMMAMTTALNDSKLNIFFNVILFYYYERS
jgi:uncharacterized membrane protein (DUF106 family)